MVRDSGELHSSGQSKRAQSDRFINCASRVASSLQRGSALVHRKCAGLDTQAGGKDCKQRFGMAASVRRFNITGAIASRTLRGAVNVPSGELHAVQELHTLRPPPQFTLPDVNAC